MNTYKEMTDLTIQQLNDELLKRRTEQFKLRLSKKNGTLDKTHKIKELRKIIARLKTVMSLKKVGSNDK